MTSQTVRIILEAAMLAHRAKELRPALTAAIHDFAESWLAGHLPELQATVQVESDDAPSLDEINAALDLAAAEDAAGIEEYRP